MSETPESVFGAKPNRWRWLKSFEFWTALATMMLAILAIISAYIAKQTLELSERAWLTSTGASLTTPVEKAKSVHFAIMFVNSGKEPATDLHFRLLTSTIPGYDSEYSDMSNVKVEKNSACNDLMPMPERAVASPGLAFGWAADSMRTEPGLVADDGIVSGAKFLVINGCVAYRTFEKVHRSSFCYVMEAHQPQANKNVTILVNTAPAGAAATQPPISVPLPPSPPQAPDAKAYIFAACSIGWNID